MKRWLSHQMMTVAYWLYRGALRLRGIDKADFEKYWANQILKEAK